MLHSSGSNDDIQWFKYMPNFFGQAVQVEWDADTMFAALPNETADWLIRNGHARLMTDEEVEQYTSPPREAAETPAETAKTSRPKKGDQA